MMKRFIIFLFIVLTSSSIKAQSVEDTKSWIINKLTKYQQEIYGGKLSPCQCYTQNYNYSFKFKRDTFEVAYNIRVLYPQCYTGDKIKEAKNYAKKIVEKIPISDISEVTCADNGLESRFLICTKLQTIRIIATFDAGNTVSFTSTAFIGLNLKTEDKLLERLQKAFNHLRLFYPKKKKRELF